jgi:hypothetical protein
MKLDRKTRLAHALGENIEMREARSRGECELTVLLPE